MRSEQGAHGSKREWLATCLQWIHAMSPFINTLSFVNDGDWLLTWKGVELGLVFDRVY